MALRPRALMSLAMALSTVPVGLNSLHASRTTKESRKDRFQQYSDILKHQKEKPPLDTQSAGEAASPLRDKEDLTSLFCPKLLQKTDSKTEPYPFAAANTGTANALDYLRSLGTGANLEKASSELFKQVESPARKELEQYQKLAQQIKANAEAYKAYTVRLRKHFSTQYKNDKEAKTEATALKKLNEKINTQASNDFQEMKALGFRMSSTYSSREADPIVNLNILHFDHGFVYRMNERKSFLNSLPRQTPISVASISGTAEYVHGGATKKLTEVFLVDGELGHKIAVDELGKYYVAGNVSNTKYEPLCDFFVADRPPQEATNISELINRFLETGHIKLSQQECADLRKQLSDYRRTGEMIGIKIENAINYQNEFAMEILIPTTNFSEDLKQSIDQVAPLMDLNKKRASETAQIIDSVTSEIRTHLTEFKPSVVSKQNGPGGLSDEIKLRQFEEDTLRYYQGEGVEASLEALKKSYPSLIFHRPDLAQKFVKAHHESRLATERINVDRIKSEGLRSKNFFPLALIQDIRMAKMMAYSAAIYSTGNSQETPTIPTSEFTYEHIVNPETGNLEIYLCEDPPGEPSLPLKRLNSKPLFTIDKGNLENLGPSQEKNGGAYNPSLLGIFRARLNCPGDPKDDF